MKVGRPLKPPRRTINLRIPEWMLSELVNKGVLKRKELPNGNTAYTGISKFIVRAMDIEIRKLRKEKPGERAKSSRKN